MILGASRINSGFTTIALTVTLIDEAVLVPQSPYHTQATQAFREPLAVASEVLLARDQVERRRDRPGQCRRRAPSCELRRVGRFGPLVAKSNNSAPIDLGSLFQQSIDTVPSRARDKDANEEDKIQDDNLAVIADHSSEKDEVMT